MFQAWMKLEELRRLHPSVNVSVYVSARSLDALQDAVGVRINHGDTTHTNTLSRDADNTHTRTQSDGEDEDEVEEDENLND
ncbi:intraflagellar transport protein 140 homolog [Tachysurus ichikawai]